MAYLTPAQPTGGGLLPQLPPGALSGYLTGAAFGNADNMNQRMMRDDDLEYAINQIRQQADQSNLGVTQATNANKVSEQGILAGQYADGTQQQLADTGAQAAISTNQGKDIANKDAIRQAVAPEVVKMGEYIKANGGKLDPTNQADIDTWKQFAGVMSLHGIKVAPFPDQGDTIKMQQWAQSAAKYAQVNAQAAVNTIPYQQKISEIKEQNQGALGVAGVHAGATESAARIGAQARVDAAKVGAEAGIQRAQISRGVGDKFEQMRNMILNKINNREDKTIHPDEAELLTFAAQEAEFNNPAYDIAKSVAMGDPDKLAQIRAATDAVAQKKLMNLPGYAQAIGQVQSGNTSAPKADNKAPLQVKSEADYNSVPSGATYIDPQGNRRVKK